MSYPAYQPCGTRARYVAGCRCEPCIEANSRYHRDHRYAQGLRHRPPQIRRLPNIGDWAINAACTGHDPELWFRDQHEGHYDQARQICDTCPVRNDCLEWAIAAREPFGMWGGLTPIERGRLREVNR